MSTKIESKIVCGVEHHATLFALLAKHTIDTFGERGKQVIIASVYKYGNERGKRMAKRAIANGDKLDLVNSQAYGEWKPEPNEMEKGVICNEPTLVTGTTKCPWCDNWEKHHLLEYGKYYCINIDEAVFNGFCSDYHVEVIKTLSWGADSCEFDWKSPMDAEDRNRLLYKKEVLGDSCIKDFNYHTSHIFYTVSETLREEFGQQGNQIVADAVQQFISIFGEQYFDAFKNLYTGIQGA
jgi:hypothetical protein